MAPSATKLSVLATEILDQRKLVAARITGINQGNRVNRENGIFSGHTDIIGDITANTSIKFMVRYLMV